MYSVSSLDMPTPNLTQLKVAVTIAERIEKLQAELAGLLGGGSLASIPKAILAPVAKGGKRTMSAEARARIAAAQRARWAKSKGAATVSVKAPAATAPKAKKRGKLSPEGRARIVAALKARHAAKRAAKK
jgi:hypothetical protein